MQKIILASTSPYRAELLQRLGVEFEQVASNTPEIRKCGETASAMSLRLATEKATSVANRQFGAIVIGADQVVEVNGQLLGKPGTVERARAQLRQQSGQLVSFYSGCAVAFNNDSGDLQLQSAVHQTRVLFRTLDKQQIDDYLAKDQPFNCAGSFKAESLGITLCASIESDDPTSLIGLPLITLVNLLRQFHPSVV